jgi:AAA lid domain
MLDELSHQLSPGAEAAFHADIKRQKSEPGFANARSVRNNLDHARLRHAQRLAAGRGRWWNREELMRLEPADILGDELTLLGDTAVSSDGGHRKPAGLVTG